jgi:hypothetical protein
MASVGNLLLKTRSWPLSTGGFTLLLLFMTMQIVLVGEKCSGPMWIEHNNLMEDHFILKHIISDDLKTLKKYIDIFSTFCNYVRLYFSSVYQRVYVSPYFLFRYANGEIECHGVLKLNWAVVGVSWSGLRFCVNK